MDFNEITKHLVNDETPSEYFEECYKNGQLQKSPLSELIKLRETEQELQFHPEGNVWNHTMLVVDNGAKIRGKSIDEKAFMWTLLLHDIGKVKTTMKREGKWTAYDHDVVGKKDGIEILEKLTDDKCFIEKVGELIRYHMHYLYISKNLPFGDVEGMKKACNIEELKLVFICDRLGRGNLTSKQKEDIVNDIEKLKI